MEFSPESGITGLQWIKPVVHLLPDEPLIDVNYECSPKRNGENLQSKRVTGKRRNLHRTKSHGVDYNKTLLLRRAEGKLKKRSHVFCLLSAQIQWMDRKAEGYFSRKRGKLFFKHVVLATRLGANLCAGLPLDRNQVGCKRNSVGECPKNIRQRADVDYPPIAYFSGDD